MDATPSLKMDKGQQKNAEGSGEQGNGEERRYSGRRRKPVERFLPSKRRIKPGRVEVGRSGSRGGSGGRGGSGAAEPGGRVSKRCRAMRTTAPEEGDRSSVAASRRRQGEGGEGGAGGRGEEGAGGGGEGGARSSHGGRSDAELAALRKRIGGGDYKLSFEPLPLSLQASPLLAAKPLAKAATKGKRQREETEEAKALTRQAAAGGGRASSSRATATGRGADQGNGEEPRYSRPSRRRKPVELYLPSKRRIKPGPKQTVARKAAVEHAGRGAPVASKDRQDSVNPPGGMEGAGSGGSEGTDQTMVTVIYRDHNRSNSLSLGLSEGVDSIAAKIARMFELAGRDIVMTMGGTTMEGGNLASYLSDGAQGTAIIEFYCRGDEDLHTPPPATAPARRISNHSGLTVGMLVTIDKLYRPGQKDSEGGEGYVMAVNADGTFTLKWIIAGGEEKNVAPDRILCDSPLNLSARRRNTDDLDRSSILSPYHVSTNSEAMAPAPSAVAKPTQPTVSPLLGLIRSSQSWDPSSGSSNPLVDFLSRGNKIGRPSDRRKLKGWLRREEARRQGIKWNDDEGGKTPHLTADENKMLYEIKREIDIIILKYGRSRPQNLTPIADLRHAYGVCNSKVQRIVKQYLEAGFSSERKKRSDTGLTIFNSQKKRDSEINPYFYYKKLQRTRHQNMGLSDAQIATGFKTISASVLQECEEGAKRLKGILTNIHGEIKRVMERSNGNVSWSKLAILIAGGKDQVQPVGHMSLRREFMRRDDFR